MEKSTGLTVGPFCLYAHVFEDSTMAIFFPDAGSAALAKFDWGAGTEAAEVREEHGSSARSRQFELAYGMCWGGPVTPMNVFREPSGLDPSPHE